MHCHLPRVNRNLERTNQNDGFQKTALELAIQGYTLYTGQIPSSGIAPLQVAVLTAPTSPLSMKWYKRTNSKDIPLWQIEWFNKYKYSWIANQSTNDYFVMINY